MWAKVAIQKKDKQLCDMIIVLIVGAEYINGMVAKSYILGNYWTLINNMGGQGWLVINLSCLQSIKLSQIAQR